MFGGGCYRAREFVQRLKSLPVVGSQALELGTCRAVSPGNILAAVPGLAPHSALAVPWLAPAGLSQTRLWALRLWLLPAIVHPPQQCWGSVITSWVCSTELPKYLTWLFPAAFPGFRLLCFILALVFTLLSFPPVDKLCFFWHANGARSSLSTDSNHHLQVFSNELTELGPDFLWCSFRIKHLLTKFLYILLHPCLPKTFVNWFLKLLIWSVCFSLKYQMFPSVEELVCAVCLEILWWGGEGNGQWQWFLLLIVFFFFPFHSHNLNQNI